MLKDKTGNRLFRKVVVTIHFPDAIFPPKTFTEHAGPRQGFGPEGLDAMLQSIADRLEELHPYWEFRLVELKPEGRTAKYVMNFAGYRPMPAIPDNPHDDSTTPVPETAIINPSIDITKPIETTMFPSLSQEQAL